MNVSHTTWLKSLTQQAASALAGKSKTGRGSRKRARQCLVEPLEMRTLLSTSGVLAAQPLLPTWENAQSNASPFVSFQGSTYFLTGDPTQDVKLWKTDGTAAGTREIRDLGAT